MKAIKFIAVATIAAVLGVAGLAGCSGTSSSSSTTSSSTSSASVSASNASTSTSSASSEATPVAKVGKHLATGIVVNTTMTDRAKEVNYQGSDFESDTGLLTLLVLDKPITVTAYKGGSDATVEVKVIKLPNDEMFRQFKDQEITIGVDKWGESPADVSGMLYDLILDSDTDGLVIVDPATF